MKEILIEQEEIRRFLLGLQAEDARARLEDRFLSDAALFERIEDAENDLVDDYVAGRLGESERAQFENYYLAQTENRAKVAAARVLRQAQASAKIEIAAAAEPNFWQSIRALFASWQAPAFAGAAALLLFAAGGLWLALRPSSTGELASSGTPLPTSSVILPAPTAQPPGNSNLEPADDRNAARPSPTVQPKEKAAPADSPRSPEPKSSPKTVAPQPVTLALVAGLVRGEGGAANKLILPKKATAVRLSFEAPTAKNYRDVRARVETVAGASLWSGKIKFSGKRAALTLPARLFADEDYLLIVSGVGAAGERTDFAQFYFNSQRK